jgi:hypothetical protein
VEAVRNRAARLHTYSYEPHALGERGTLFPCICAVPPPRCVCRWAILLTRRVREDVFRTKLPLGIWGLGVSMRTRGARDASGASAVEFALVLPLLIMLIFGIFAFGFGFARWVALTGAAREGARYMAIHSGSDPSAPADAVGLALDHAWLACGPSGADCTVPAPPPCGAGGGDVTFEMTMAQFSPLNIPLVPGIDLTRPMTVRAVMQCGG